MSFVVYQNGNRCSSYGIVGWQTDIFATKREAEVHAYHWAYPVSREEAEKRAPNMELGKEYNYGMCGREFPVHMSVLEVGVDDGGWHVIAEDYAPL